MQSETLVSTAKDARRRFRRAEEPETFALTAKDAAKAVGISRSQFWKLHSAGKVPLPVYLGSKAPRWLADELRAWIAAGAPDRQTWQRMQKGVAK
jgi:predicted DNA-binding transcriptional regulator AlpA